MILANTFPKGISLSYEFHFLIFEKLQFDCIFPRQCTQDFGPVSSEFPIVNDNRYHTLSELNVMAFILYSKTAKSSIGKLSLIMCFHSSKNKALTFQGHQKHHVIQMLNYES